MQRRWVGQHTKPEWRVRADTIQAFLKRRFKELSK